MIYFDNSATTKPSAASLDKMREALSNDFGNPSSKHLAGDGARKLMDEARKSIGEAFGIRRPSDGEIIFTSGGSEANCLAIFGSVFAKERHGGKIFITDGEHSSVNEPAKRLEKSGFTVLKIPTAGGVLDLDFIRENADSTVILAAMMLVNNETGALYDIKSASDIIKSAAPKSFIHCDAVQGFMKTKINPKALGCDSIAVSSHKIFAPKGAGALYITADVIKGKRLSPIIYGGGQENGFRSGTENVPAIAGFGAAAREGMAELSGRIAVTEKLRSYLIGKLPEEVRVNRPEKYIPNIINITLPGIKSETMLNFLSSKGICVSSGSACSSHAPGISRALTAFGLTDIEADHSLRISLSHLNTEGEIDEFTEALTEGLAKLVRVR